VSELDGAARELERAAARLRAEDIDPDEAAALVERCAELAVQVGAALDRQAAAPADPAASPPTSTDREKPL
jgi:hypothetical protein